MTSLPVTDAFDNSDPLEQLDVELTSAQIDWLEEMAAEQGVSVGHILRTVVTAQMQEEREEPTVSISGDGEPPSFVDDAANRGAADVSASDTAADEEPSLLDRLRSTSEKVSKEEKEEDPETEPTTSSDASSLFPHLEETESSDESVSTDRRSDPGPQEDAERSMFDMVEE